MYCFGCLRFLDPQLQVSDKSWICKSGAQREGLGCRYKFKSDTDSMKQCYFIGNKQKRAPKRKEEKRSLQAKVGIEKT